MVNRVLVTLTPPWALQKVILGSSTEPVEPFSSLIEKALQSIIEFLTRETVLLPVE